MNGAKFDRDRADMARLARTNAPEAQLWHGRRPVVAPAGALRNTNTGQAVPFDVYVLSPENFERAEQAIALCMAHGLLGPTV